MNEVANTPDQQDAEPSASSSQQSDSQPPLPDEVPPPLPTEQPPLPNEHPPLQVEQRSSEAPDDGWEPVWDESAQAFYFYNRITQATQWENPRLPETTPAAPSLDQGPPGVQPLPKKPVGGYDPAIHGDYDPNADYAQVHHSEEPVEQQVVSTDPAAAYTATATFNRFTGKWQAADMNPERFSDEAKSKRQMSAFFDVDAAANSHDGKSLRAERSNKKLSKAELKAYREKRKEKKEERRRAWLRD